MSYNIYRLPHALLQIKHVWEHVIVLLTNISQTLINSCQDVTHSVLFARCLDAAAFEIFYISSDISSKHRQSTTRMFDKVVESCRTCFCGEGVQIVGWSNRSYLSWSFLLFDIWQFPNVTGSIGESSRPLRICRTRAWSAGWADLAREGQCPQLFAESGRAARPSGAAS